MGSVSTLKKQVQHQDKIREIFGGKAIGKLSPAELEAAIPQIEELVDQAKSNLDAVESKLQGKAVEMLGTEGGLDKLRELSAQLIPLRTEYDTLQLALKGARNALEAAVTRAKQAAVQSARSDIERIIGERQACADRINALLDQFAGEFALMQDLWRDAIKAGDEKLRTAFGHGLKLEGNTSTGGRPEQMQREVEIHLGQHVRGWQTNNLPFGVRPFSQLSGAWNAQFLSDFDTRFSDLEFGKRG